MDVKDFTGEQQKALIDLATLAMYADGHLASAEDERVQRLLKALGYSSDYALETEYDAAIGRVSRHSQSEAAARSYISELARHFTRVDHRRQAYSIVNDLINSDSHVRPRECIYLTVVREAFEL